MGCLDGTALVEPEDPQDRMLPSHSRAGRRLRPACGGRATTMLQLSVGKQQDALLGHQVPVTWKSPTATTLWALGFFFF